MPLLHALAPRRRAVREPLEACADSALETFPMPGCETIRANRCRLAPDEAFRGYRVAHRDYFHGLKVPLLVASGGFIVAFWFTPGSWHDLTGLDGLALEVAEGGLCFWIVGTRTIVRRLCWGRRRSLMCMLFVGSVLCVMVGVVSICKPFLRW
jgi:hypothetical protein